MRPLIYIYMYNSLLGYWVITSTNKRFWRIGHIGQVNGPVPIPIRRSVNWGSVSLIQTRAPLRLFRWRDGRSQEGTQWRYHGKKDLGIESLHEKHLWVCLNIAQTYECVIIIFPMKCRSLVVYVPTFQEPKIFPPVFLLRHVFPVFRGERLGATGYLFSLSKGEPRSY